MTASGRPVGRVIAVVLLVAALTFVGASRVSAATYPYQGTLAKCSWSVGFGDDDSATVAINCASAVKGAISLQASGSCSPNVDTSGGVIDLDDLSFSYRGDDYDFDPSVRFGVTTCPADASHPSTSLQGSARAVAADAEQVALSDLLSQERDTVNGLDPQQSVTTLLSDQQKMCARTEVPKTEPYPWCDSGPSDIGWKCTIPETRGGCPNEGVGDGDSGAVGGSDSSDASQDQESLCPEVNSLQKSTIYVCVPSYVQGNWNAGKRSVVILPGGALIALPIGGTLTNLKAGPTITSARSIVSLGGLVAGWNITFSAPKIEVAGSEVGVLNDLTLKGSTVWLGKVNINDAVGSLWSPIRQLVKTIESVTALKQSGTVAAPIDVEGAHIALNVKKNLLLTSSSTIGTTGLGGIGGTGGSNYVAPTGERDLVGGSNGGLGGYQSDSPGEQSWSIYRAMGGRAAAAGNPFAPTRPGDGGGAAETDIGNPGGGVVRVDAPAATVAINGHLDVDGFQAGSGGDCGCGNDGGAGAGGSTYLTAKALSGTGSITANGGDICPSCVNAAGGAGAGGRIAIVTAKSRGWKGHVLARGGYDKQYNGLTPTSDQRWRGTGGAGTVFTRAVAFTKSGKIQKGTGKYSDGTITIDAGRSASDYPVADGTPLQPLWNNRHRRLVLSGQARVYATTVNYGEITLSRGSVLTTMGGKPNQTLRVTADKLVVDATSRIDMSGRGAAGGTVDNPNGLGTGGAVKGQTPSNDGYGGSYAGAGGKPATDHIDGSVGSSYGSRTDPTQSGGGGAADPSGEDPGNPGGGVLDVTATTLTLNGVIAANGGGSEGPTVSDPATYGQDGGAGAGGSVIVHATTLSGTGRISADGGDSCLTDAMMLDRIPTDCSYPDGENAGGGGGRVAVFTTACSWAGTIAATGGSDPMTHGAGRKQEAGGDGSTYFSNVNAKPANGCPVNTKLPSISGKTKVGKVLSATTGTWAIGAHGSTSGLKAKDFSYQWEVCASTCTDIAAATNRTFKLTSAESGKHIAVIVIATASHATVSAESRQVGPIKKA
jgi:hypothetical protein